MPLDVSVVRRNLRKLRKLLKKRASRPSPEEVHDLRTRTRRFEATVEALGLDRRRNERRSMSRLGKLRKRAGRVRDMDVLTGYAATVEVDDEQDCLVELLEHLGAERYRHARRLSRRIRRDRGPLRRRLRRTSKRIEKRIPADGADGSVMNAMATALKLASELAAPAALTRKNLHPYRLKVKQLRNVLRMASDADRDGFVARLGEVKDAIGEWHDWETLATIASTELAHGARCGLLRELRTLCDRRYEHALSLTTKLRKDRGFLARRGGATPVLEATAAIAS